MKYHGNAGPTFIDISYWKQKLSSDDNSIKESSGTGKGFAVCEANFRFPSATLGCQVSGRECWCSGTGRVCTEPGCSAWRIPAVNRVVGHCVLDVNWISRRGSSYVILKLIDVVFSFVWWLWFINVVSNIVGLFCIFILVLMSSLFAFLLSSLLLPKFHDVTIASTLLFHI